MSMSILNTSSATDKVDDPHSSEHLIALQQVQDQLESMRKQLLAKDQQLLEKDKQVGQVFDVYAPTAEQCGTNGFARSSVCPCWIFVYAISQTVP